MRTAKTLATVTILLAGISASAQRQQGVFGGGAVRNGGFANGAPCIVVGGPEIREDLSHKIDHTGFVYGRLRYHVQPFFRGPEVPWHHDYPNGDTMLPDALARLSNVRTTRDSFRIVDIDSEELFKYPFVYMSEPGYLDLRPDDVKNLREYLDRGGFILVDDFRGNPSDMHEMENFVVQLKKMYPDRNLEPVPPTHAIFHSFFEIDPVGLEASYTRPNSGPVQFLGLSDENNRLVIMVDFNYDASEYWQALDMGQCSMHQAGTAVQLGINYVVYAMTH
jgi:hypothetical protein